MDDDTFSTERINSRDSLVKMICPYFLFEVKYDCI